MEKEQMDENPSVHQESLQLSQEQNQPEESQSLLRNLLIVLFGFSIIGILIGLLIGLLHQESLTRQGPVPCLSAACEKVAKLFSDAIDPFTQPCDYFLLGCGAGTSTTSRGRHQDKIIPHNVNIMYKQRREGRRVGGMRMGKGSETQERRDKLPHRSRDRLTALLQTMREILESPDSIISMKSVEQKAQRFYQTCMDSNKAKSESTERFMTLIQQFGGWPVSRSWTKPNFNSTLARLMAQYNTFPFFNVYVGPDFSGRQRYIQIDQPDFLIPIDWNINKQRSVLNKQSLRPFYSSCRDLLSLLNVSVISTAQYCGLYVSLSSTLVTHTSPYQYRLSQKELYYKISIQELQVLAPAIDWLSCLQAIFNPLLLNQSDIVLLHNRHYIVYMSQTISEWLPKHEIMESYPVHIYMILTLLQTLIPALDSRFIQTIKNFTAAFDSENEEQPHWKHCVLQTVKGFDTLLSHLIKEQYASVEAKELIDDIYSSFKTKVSRLDWKDKKTQHLVLNKLKSLTPRLSPDSEFFSQMHIDQHYTEIIISENDYFFNYLQLLVLQQKWRRRLLSHISQPDVLSMSLIVSGNDILIPVGMFVTPHFHSSYPRAVNYGMLGTLIAKDLFRLLLPDIFSQSDSLQMESLCVWLQYHRVTSSLISSQQQELWVQYSALQIALQAYITSFQRNSSDTAVSGLSYIHLFLTSFTQASCTSDLHNTLMPFEPAFLVTVLCSNYAICPKPVICVNRSQEHLPEGC